MYALMVFIFNESIKILKWFCLSFSPGTIQAEGHHEPAKQHMQAKEQTSQCPADPCTPSLLQQTLLSALGSKVPPAEVLAGLGAKAVVVRAPSSTGAHDDMTRQTAGRRLLQRSIEPPAME